MGYKLIPCEECGAMCHGIPDGKGGIIKRCLLHRAEPKKPIAVKKYGTLKSGSGTQVRGTDGD